MKTVLAMLRECVETCELLALLALGWLLVGFIWIGEAVAHYGDAALVWVTRRLNALDDGA